MTTNLGDNVVLMKMTRTMALPCLFGLIQVLAFIFFPERFDNLSSDIIKYQIIAAYLAFFSGILFSSVFIDKHTSNKSKQPVELSKNVKKIIILIVIFGSIIYGRVIFLSFKEIFDSGLLGIRDRFFFDESYFIELYGSKGIMLMNNLLIMPFFISMLIYGLQQNKFVKIIAWYIANNDFIQHRECRMFCLICFGYISFCKIHEGAYYENIL
jgi:hypothetical protein